MTRVSSTEVGQRLVDFIHSKGWTKKEFARRMEINPANVSKYIKGELDVQHIVVPLIASGCDVTTLFFDGSGRPTMNTPINDPPVDRRTVLSHTLMDLLDKSDSDRNSMSPGECSELRWLRVNKKNGAGVFPILISGDCVLLCSDSKVSDGDLVEVKMKKHDPTLKVAYFDHEMVMLRSINPLVRPIAANVQDVILSKVVLVRKK